MVAAVHEAPTTDVDHVIAAVISVYAAHREAITEMPLAEFTSVPAGPGSLRSVVAAGQRTVEIALDDEADAASLAAVAWDLAGRGWKAVVVVPLDRLGAAHGDLRGAPCSLQGWWRSETGIDFTPTEVP
jgi:hypothetical protein